MGAEAEPVQKKHIEKLAYKPPLRCRGHLFREEIEDQESNRCIHAILMMLYRVRHLDFFLLTHMDHLRILPGLEVLFKLGLIL